MKNLNELKLRHSDLKILINEESITFLKSITQKEREMIYKKISYGLDNIDNLQPLRHDLKGFYKIKVADFRVVIKTEQKKTILIYIIGRRKDVYENLKRKV